MTHNESGTTEANVVISEMPAANNSATSSKPRKPRKNQDKKKQAEKNPEGTTEKKKKTRAPKNNTEASKEKVGESSNKPLDEDSKEGQVEKKRRKRKPKAFQQSEIGETKLQPSYFKNRTQGQLTLESNDTSSSSNGNGDKQAKKNKGKQKGPTILPLPLGERDMATTLIHDLKNSVYECMICMDVIKPAHHTWGCDCCWAVFHLNCIQSWSSKSLKDTSSNKMITQWRCPGCQSSRTAIPKDYICFCGKQRNPEPSKYRTPHSCHQLCKKHKSCPHECILPCHPGPCPPCNSMGPIRKCFCGKTTQQKQCTNTDYSTPGFACDIVCEAMLGCGKHRCKENCHPGLCPPCSVEETQACYCGKHQKKARCGSGKYVRIGEHIGSYNCEEKCQTFYNCEKHACNKPCHPCTANTQTCPFDPSLITTCPCGSQTVLDLTQNRNRTSCTDPIPTCSSKCNKKLPCGHLCQDVCHTGECSPCTMTVQVSCRCQMNQFEKTCSEVCEAAGGEPPLCTRVCKAGRNCGRHQCGAVCCPAVKVNGKSRKGTEFLHDCSNTCNKLLSCGIHDCQERCHKGKCPPCLEAVFEDVTCHCNRTRLEPPVRCGTKLPDCQYSCIRPNPCGHVRFLNHNCHPDEEPCPPCPVLVSRHCQCGKTELKNVPCYRESPRCGRPCESPLPCGKHLCPKTCHNGPCVTENETCTQYCNDSRSCGHPCKERCHNGSACPEKEPCTNRIKASCKCGQNTMEIPCNATAESSGSKKLLECNDFCAKVLRNRRLAMALDIKRDDFGTSSLSLDDLGYYDDTLRDFYSGNRAWCRSMEMSLIEFTRDSAKKTSHLRPMRSEYRQFIHRYAVHFNIATEAIDAEPKRSVILRKTLGPCRIPPILLSKAITNPALNRPPQTIEAAISGEIIKTTKQPVNAIYLSDMAFGLTKIELDAELVMICKMGDQSVSFNSTWVNENDAVVVPSIVDAISMDEKENTIWLLKKIIKNAFVSNEDSKKKASRVDCCWVNQKGEITWSEKQAFKNDDTHTINDRTNNTRSVNSFEALSNTEDDGWLRVGEVNPYKIAKDAWKEELNKSPVFSKNNAVENENEDSEDNSLSETPVVINKKELKGSNSESDDWELLADEKN
ncbi:hypothetical protein BY458DRAFT_68498 [Sporodiniella umbellata]|nr:hypothetical protein BY458DRAFT_68498 [Sporodiniella umbellata]